MLTDELKPQIKVQVFEPHGFVRLVDWHGDELSIVNAARVSLAKESKAFEDNDRGLLRYLAKEKHGSPFEHGFLSSWHVRVPIFVAREWVRHRIGHSYNEESGRYVDLRPDFYFPSSENVHAQIGKPGRYKFEAVKEELAEQFIARLGVNSYAAYQNYQWAVDNGISREDARMFLPVNLYTEIRWTANARSLLNFFELRSASQAQFEIRKYSWAMESIFNEYMPNVYSDFVQNGRIAP